MTEGEFFRLSEKYRHKKAATFLRNFFETQDLKSLSIYRRLEGWMQLSTLDTSNFPALSDRYHLHLQKAEVSWQEHNLLSPSRVKDRPSEAPLLPVYVYLDNLRSAYNVGSILRTTEAFGFSGLYFGGRTPDEQNSKVQKTSMFTFDKVRCHKGVSLQALLRPLIALETDPLAPSIFDFAFPPEFTLLLGNEEYGLSPESLRARDTTVCIPLFGFKNSLNVASAYAIAAGVISHQLRP